MSDLPTSFFRMKSGWMIVAGFLFGIQAVFVKLSSQHFSCAIYLRFYATDNT